jgi:hypothetical protein
MVWAKLPKTDSFHKSNVLGYPVKLQGITQFGKVRILAELTLTDLVDK